MISRKQDQEHLKAIFFSGLNAVVPKSILPPLLQANSNQLEVAGEVFDRKTLRNVWLLGAGKASGDMAQIIEPFLLKECSQNYQGGLIVVKDSKDYSLERTKILMAGHPLPDDRGEKAVHEIYRILEKVKPEDVILFLLSGGGSSLLPAPSSGISLREKQKLTDLLLNSGASIHEINILRKHCSELKGGNFLKKTKGARVLTLAISDVPKDLPESIASGITVPDPTTLADCLEILDRLDLVSKVPKSVLNLLKNPQSETPKPGDEIFRNSVFKIIATNQIAVKSSIDKAKKLGFRVITPPVFFSDPISQVVKRWEELKLNCDQENNQSCVIVCGGEPTVQIHGKGLGGRNMELSLRLSNTLTGKFSFLSAGTDGQDGPTDAAGAFCDESTWGRADKMGLEGEDFLNRNDSYTFFKRLNDLFITGPTGTNVMDLQILLAHF